MPPKKTSAPAGPSKKAETKKKEKVIEVNGRPLASHVSCLIWQFSNSQFLLYSWVIINSFILQDKTFGLKNKKGSKQQKFIQQVEKQVKSLFSTFL